MCLPDPNTRRGGAIVGRVVGLVGRVVGPGRVVGRVVGGAGGIKTKYNYKNILSGLHTHGL